MSVRALIVDDSPTMRGIIAAALNRDPEIEVVGYAADPIEARDAIKRLDPDVLTLDVEMPNMNGLAFLERLMRLRPMPVVMVSTLTQAGAEISLAAMELGAVDCVGKPTNGEAVRDALSDLAMKVKDAARARVRPPREAPAAPAPARNYVHNGALLAIGASTGGVEALITVLHTFPANCPPTVITQHMPKTFTRSFAARLDRGCAAHVEEASDGAPLAPGRIYLAPGGDTHLEVTGGLHPRCKLVEAPPVNGHRPSVDVMFHSVARTHAQSVGLLLTGMGKDGAEGLLAMRKAGAHTAVQDEATSVVYGMPRVAHEIGAAGVQAPLHRLGEIVLDMCSTKQRKAS